jgi:hypothetical protein
MLKRDASSMYGCCLQVDVWSCMRTALPTLLATVAHALLNTVTSGSGKGVLVRKPGLQAQDNR